MKKVINKKSEVTGVLKGKVLNLTNQATMVLGTTSSHNLRLVTPSLTSLFNDQLNSSVFLSQLKVAKIQMIPKKISTMKILENRPISPTIGKIFDSKAEAGFNSYLPHFFSKNFLTEIIL